MSIPNLNISNTYLWKLEIFNSKKRIIDDELIISEVNKWTPNCNIYNMILGRIKTLLNLSKQEIDKANNEIKNLDINHLVVSVSIMNAAQYLRYSIESIISQLVNNNVKILSKDANQISETWRIKSIFNVLDINKIDWTIKNLPIVYSVGTQVCMNFKRKKMFNELLINEYFEYLSDILHDKHILHEKCKIIHATTIEEYKQKEIECFKNDIFNLNNIYENIYEIICDHSILLENGECSIIVKNFKIVDVIPAKFANNICKY